MTVTVPIEILGLQPDGITVSGWTAAIIVAVLGIAAALPAAVSRPAHKMRAVSLSLLAVSVVATLVLFVPDGFKRDQRVVDITDQAAATTAMAELGLAGADVPARSLENVSAWTFYQDEYKIRVDGSAEHLLPNGLTLIAQVSDDRAHITYSVR